MAPKIVKIIRGTIARWCGKRPQYECIKSLFLNDRILSVRVKRSKRGAILYLRRKQVQGALDVNNTYTTKVNVAQLEEIQLTEACPHLAKILEPLEKLNVLHVVGQNITEELARNIDSISVQSLVFTSCQFDVGSLNIVFRKLCGHQSTDHSSQHRLSSQPSELVQSCEVTGLEVQSYPGSRTSIDFSVRDSDRGVTMLNFNICTVSAILRCAKTIDPDPLAGLDQLMVEIGQLALPDAPQSESLSEDAGTNVTDTMDDSVMSRSPTLIVNNKENIRQVAEFRARLGRANSVDSGLDFSVCSSQSPYSSRD